MLLSELSIENIQSYENQNIDFESGGTLIYGSNGAGKSTIFRSVFGALFPWSAKNEISTEFLLEDFVRRGADQGLIELLFEVGGAEYTVEWVIGADGNTDSCTLESEALSEPITGVRDVEGVISKDLLGMDASSFVSSVYVQQGDIARLVHADEDTRQKILDGLLGLNRVDRLKDRSVEARREAKQVRDDAESRLGEARDALEDFPEKDGLQKEIQSLTADIKEQEAEIEKHQKNIEEIQNKLEKWEGQLKEVDDLREELEGLQEELQEAREEYGEYGTQIEAAQEVKAEAQNERQEHEEAIDDLNAEVEEYDLSTEGAADAALDEITETSGEVSEQKASLQADLDNARDEVVRLEGEVEDVETALEEARDDRNAIEEAIEEQEARIEELEAAVEEARDQAATAEEKMRERAASLPIPEDADLETLQNEVIPEVRDDLADDREAAENLVGRLQTKLDQLEDLDEDEKCPVCGAEHEDGRTAAGHTVEEALANTRDEIEDLQNKQEKLTEQREVLAALRSDIGDGLDQWEQVEDEVEAVEDAQEELNELHEGLEEQEAECEDAEEALVEVESELADANEEVESLEEEVAEVAERLDGLDDLEESIEQACEHYERIDDLQTEIENANSDLETAKKLQRKIQDQIDDLERDLEDVEANLEDIDIEDLQNKTDEHEIYLDKAEEKRAETEDEREKLVETRADKRATLEQIETQEDRVDSLVARKDWAEAILADIKNVIDAYDDVKAEVREQNVELLNAYANDVFDDLYQNQSYSGLEIGQNYSIDLITSDGERAKPEVGSGGEQTVVNLALRAGVYRLVAKRDASDGQQLPPFILDEPTTALDSDHVDELHSVIQAISEWNVPQVLVVSHNDRLIQNADTALHVKKDPAEDASIVTRAHATGKSASPIDD